MKRSRSNNAGISAVLDRSDVGSIDAAVAAAGSGAANQTGECTAAQRCYEVLYGQISTRKHKRWQGDGLLFCRERYVVLQNEDGEEIAKANGFSIRQLSELTEGSRLKLNAYELEVQAERCLGFSPFPANTESENCLNSNPSTIGVAENCSGAKKIARCSFISPIFGRDDQLDLVLDEQSDENDCDRWRRVTVDARIARYLRPHQIDGVHFMYKHLKDGGGGIILADEMGLGKSVQTISLITALLRKRLNCEPIIRKCVIVVPTSLVNNWYAEFIKWSPQSRASLFVAIKSADVDKLIGYPKLSTILIISYDLLARVIEKFAGVSIELLVCDEAHRLKNLNGRLREQMYRLNAHRRLLLTGTPMQNDLEEFFSLLNFARPDLFSSFAEFKYLCEIEKFLCYDHLTLVDVLRKLCNHPSILFQSVVSRLQTCKEEEKEFYKEILRLFPDTYNHRSLSLADSGKLSVLADLLGAFRVQNEKVVVVSNFTKCLDLLEGLCRSLYFDVLRLDGSTEARKRMQIVDKFNSTSATNCAFLLSAKAGGLGLNLFGASRMVLFDSDWNPAVDVQAMARIWRQGQQKPCHIYRLITAGTVDEKILQRQIKKSSLSTVIEMISVESLTHFSDEELQDIFTLHEDEECETHCLIECTCDGNGLLLNEIAANHEEVDEEDIDDADSEKCVSSENEENANSGSVLSSVADDPPLTDDKCDDPENCKTQQTENEKRTQEDDVSLSASALMGTLLRWRHYSPRHHEQFEQMKGEAGLGNCDLQDVSFVMKSALMGTLLRWRHYSPRHHEQFEQMKGEAGLGNCDLQDVSFVMKVVSNF
ncbi:unnamed protein product [Gongylonema pulchrum]|uniref:DNA repair and recombination protein RAD54-like n=1 Tax=Gongylonema pulchrum TaxID=637853 RepID=A0A183DPD0_9BILA|nr:unnamed protein product [Gongylonema pulchrum]